MADETPAPAPEVAAAPPEGAAPAPVPAPGGAAPAPEAAIEYTDFDVSGYPQGVELDQGLKEQFVALGKEAKLSQEAMQKLINLDATRTKALQEHLLNAHKTQVDAWEQAVRTDPEIGGAKLDGTLATAAKALESFGSPELREYLESTGLGNHPAMVKFAFKIGKMVSEDTLITGREPTRKPDLASRLYPTSVVTQ